MEQVDGSTGQWIADALERYLNKERYEQWIGTVAATLPEHFQAYARILHRVNVGQIPVLRWADVAAEKKTLVHPEVQFHSMARTGLYKSVVINGVDQGSPARGELDEFQLAALTAILQVHTATPESVYQGVWDGWGGFDPGVTEGVPCAKAGKLNVAHGLRQYFVFHGTSGDLASPPWFDTWLDGDGGSNFQTANLAWPADRSWCTATEIDFDSTLVGGAAELIAAIITSPDLEALEVGAATSLGFKADTINGSQQ